VLEPQHGEAWTCQDSQQQDMLAFLQTLQKDLDNCRHLNLMRLAQLQLQMFAVEQKHQDLISQKHQYQAMMEQVPLPSAKATGWAVQVTHPQPHVPCNHLRPSEAPLLPNSSAEGSDQPSEHRAHSSCHVQDKNAAPHSQLQADSCCGSVCSTEQSWVSAAPMGRGLQQYQPSWHLFHPCSLGATVLGLLPSSAPQHGSGAAA